MLLEMIMNLHKPANTDAQQEHATQHKDALKETWYVGLLPALWICVMQMETGSKKKFVVLYAKEQP